VSVVEYHKAARSGWQHNQVIQPEEHVTIVIDGPPLLELFSQSLVLHGEIGAPLSTYNNFFMHVPRCFQESDRMKVCPFHIDPPGLWLWPVGDVVLALRLHLAGTIRTITPLRATRIHHDVATATNDHLALGAPRNIR